jgi:hypothetical protein
MKAFALSQGHRPGRPSGRIAGALKRLEARNDHNAVVALLFSGLPWATIVDFFLGAERTQARFGKLHGILGHLARQDPRFAERVRELRAAHSGPAEPSGLTFAPPPDPEDPEDPENA